MNKAVFKKAYAMTSELEGGWHNRKYDLGGETVQGIARNHWPNWPGWIIVDKEKSVLGVTENVAVSVRLDKNLRANQVFQDLVQEFYQFYFWSMARCRIVVKYDPTLAVLMYDAAVNHGPERAVRFLQQTLNLLNKNGLLFQDLVEDGQFGNKTEAALRLVIQRYPKEDKGQHLIRTWYVVIRGAFYITVMKKSVEQETHAFGWGNRLRTWMKLVDEDISLD